MGLRTRFVAAVAFVVSTTSTPLALAQRRATEEEKGEAHAHAGGALAAPDVGDGVPLHCGGNTGYSCIEYVLACVDFGGTPGCTPVQVPTVMGGGTNGAICTCKSDHMPQVELEGGGEHSSTLSVGLEPGDDEPVNPGPPDGDGAVEAPERARPSGGLLDPGAVVEGGASCLVDFSDEEALELSESSLWFDRIYVPWFQLCEQVGHVDLRPTVYSHFHLGFEDTEVVPCSEGMQAFPSRIDDEGECEFVDVPTEPRTHVYSHGSEESFSLRVWNASSNAHETFDLDQVRVLSDVKLCYHKAVPDPSEWEAAGPGGPPTAWYCWEHLAPGTYDLSSWAWDVSEVTLTGAEGSHAPVMFDDLIVSP